VSGVKTKLAGISALLGITAAAIVVTYVTVPRGNTEQTRFDTLIMLGSPANPDGTPSVEERERVMEAVEEFKLGRAGHIIVTGGAAHNQWTEGEIEARIAVQAGVPAEDVLVEGRSTNTIQNVFYSFQMMKVRGWTSAEVVSSGSHLPRSGLILERYEPLGLKWRVKASRWPREYGPAKVTAYYLHEAIETTKLRWFGFSSSASLPDLSEPK
jgi:uncharacterized SAM-binding protein YcdF (DUF218 family)